MDDLELLERAARAGGVTIIRRAAGNLVGLVLADELACLGRGWGSLWNPLVNQGQTFDLAGRLGLQVDFNDGVVRNPAAPAGTWWFQPRDLADAQRSIVMAAAAGAPA